MTINSSLLFLFLSLQTTLSLGQNSFTTSENDSLKGTISKERIWWDVQHYDILVEIDVHNRSIYGRNIVDFNVIQESHSPFMQIDLQEPLTIDSIKAGENKLGFERYGDAYFVNAPNFNDKNGQVEIYYSGVPKRSERPPYDGGFVWAKDSLGRDWISVACQLVGGSIWYPCKDHYSEEPDRGASLTVSIDNSLGVVVGNGRMKSRTTKPGGKTVYVWSVSQPISNYGISFYIGNYINFSERYEGEKGSLDLDFWFLDYNLSKGLTHLVPEAIKTLRTFEKWFGPYPFYEDGFKMVEASYIGMEHQSAVAYGNKYKKGRYSLKNLTALDLETDRLIVHELGHEWFGNNITMSELADRWVQEGFAAYGEELFIEELFGRNVGREFFLTRASQKIKNRYPLISNYGVFKDAGPDMYFKGWAIIHMLREIVNDDIKFRDFLRRLNEVFYHQTIYSKQLEEFCSDFLKKDFSKYFEQYLRFPSVPMLEYRLIGRVMEYRLAADVEGIEIPIKLRAPEKWILATGGWKTMELSKKDLLKTISIDPNFLINVTHLKD